LLSTATMRWLSASKLVARDVQQARELAEGRARAYKGPGSGRIPQDVILGFWLAHVPELRLVEIQPFTSWADKWKFVGNLRSLLIAHRVPWERMAWLSKSTSRLWAAEGAAAFGKLRCADRVCAPGACTSLPSQQACRMEVVLELGSGNLQNYGCFACRCWTVEGPGLPTRWSNGTCRFLRTALPRLPADCWAPGT
jgi:hypothetical protein